MNRTTLNFLWVLSISFFLFSQVSAGETIWVSSKGAKLKADKSASSKTIAELPVGTELSVQTKDDRWYQVIISSGEKGWIYRGKVSGVRPESSQNKSESGSIGNLFGKLSGSSIQADASDTSRSIRGLSEEAKAYAKKTGASKSYQKALDDVLSLQIRSNEIEDFLNRGQIGEYAK